MGKHSITSHAVHFMPNKSCQRFLTTVALVIGVSLANAAGVNDTNVQWRYVTNGPESPSDLRYAYHWKVLRAALDASRHDFGDYSVTMAQFMTESRQVAEMTSRNGQINTMVLDSTSELERDLVPVKIPVDKGLLGYRVFLIRSEDQVKFSAVTTLNDLRKFSIGQGSDWSDVAVYKAAGFNVVGGTSYEGLFNMLMYKRFDAFGRGVTEVLPELKGHREKLPEMVIEKDILLYYPMPVYFWFPKTDEGRRFAKRVEFGMNMVVNDGTLDRMFRENYGPVIKELNLKSRRIFKVENPDLPPNQPFKDARFWYDPLR